MARNNQNVSVSREVQAAVIEALQNEGNAPIETVNPEVSAQDTAVNAVGTPDTNTQDNGDIIPANDVDNVSQEETIIDGSDGESDGEPDESENANTEISEVPSVLSLDDIEGDAGNSEGVTAKTFAAVVFIGNTLRMFTPTTKIKPAYNAAMDAVKKFREKNVDMRRNPAEFRNVGRNWVGYDNKKNLILVEVRDVTGQTAKDQKPEPVKPTYQTKA